MTTPLDQTRAAFEAHRMNKNGGLRPQTWAAGCENMGFPMPPAKHHDNYMFREDQAAWEAWQAAIASMAASQWRPLIEAPVDDIVMVAAEFDGPGDWRIKCGYLDKQTMQWRVFGASWEPTHWQPLPAPPTPQDPPIAALAAKEKT